MPKVTQKEDITRIWGTVSICYSDIPDEAKFLSANGKEYLNLILCNLPDVKEFGNRTLTHEFKAGKGDKAKTVGNMTEYKKEVSPQLQSEPEPPKKFLNTAKEEKPSYSKDDSEDSLPF